MKAFSIFAGFAVATMAASTPVQVIISQADDPAASSLRIAPVHEPVSHAVPAAAAPAIRDPANDSPIVRACLENTLSGPTTLCKRKILANDSSPRITESRLGLFLAVFALSFVSLWLSFLWIEAAISWFIWHCANQFYNNLRARALYEMELARQEEDAILMEEGVALDDESTDKPSN